MNKVKQSWKKFIKTEQIWTKFSKIKQNWENCRKFNKVEEYWKFDAWPPKYFVKIAIVGHFVGCCQWSGCCGGCCVSF